MAEKKRPRNAYDVYENIYGSDSVYENFATVNSPFTDLAGNSLADGWSATQFAGGSEIYVDTVAPEFSGTNISGSMMRDTIVSTGDEWPEDIDRSQVFAGIGDTITVSVDFNEEIDVNPANVTAVLNIKDSSGKNLTLKGEKAEALRTGVNSNIDITRITFETIEITSDMVPEDDGNPIGVKTLTLPPNTADLCGNEFASAEITVTAPARQQEWLDTVAPSISAMGIIPEESYYGSDETNTVSGFCLPVQITDNRYADDIISAANADKYVSGANGVGDSSQAQESGKIILKDASDEKDGALYEYCVTSSQDVPSSESWAKARTGEELPFVQLENGNFIHIRLAEDSDRPVFEPVLTVKGYDYAGNFAEYEAVSDAPLYEKIAPTSEAELRYSADLNVAEAIGTAAAEDAGGIAELKYKAVVIGTDQDSVEKSQTPAPEEAQTDSSWQTVDTGDGRQTKIEFDVDGVMLEAGKNNFLYFYIYTMDRSGNISVTVDEFNFNLLLPSFEISVPQGISDGKVSVSKLNKDDAKELGWTAATVRNIDAYANRNDNYIRTYGALYVVLRDTRNNNTIGMFIDDLTDANSALSVPSSTFEPVSKAPFENLEITDLLSQLAVSEDVPVYIDANVPMSYFDGAMTWEAWGVNFDSLDLVSSIGATTNFAMGDYEMDNPEYIEGYKENVRNTAESFSNYYGEVEMYTLVLDSVFTSQQNHDTPDDPVNAAKSWVQFLQTPESERSLAGRVTGEWGNPVKPAMVQKYVVKTARDDGDLSNPINTASMTSLRDASGHAISPSDPRLYEGGGLYDGTEPIRFKSLNGIQLAFSISNNRMPEWGVGDIDFEDSFVRIYKDGVSDPVYKSSLPRMLPSSFLYSPILNTKAACIIRKWRFRQR